jgi:hypothetical protein
MRIALHPSAVDALQVLGNASDRRLPLLDGHSSDAASHEWNYLPTGRLVLPSDWTIPFDRDAYIHQSPIDGPSISEPSHTATHLDDLHRTLCQCS